MIYERLNIKIDIEQLQKHLKEHVLPLEATYQSEAFGGWSVLSSNGSHTDGWHKGHHLYLAGLDQEQVKQQLQSAKAKRAAEYVVPTEICHGYMQELIDIISGLGLQPQRARIIQLAAGGESIWHQDAASHVYGVRLHIPIITNEGCFFEIETESAHMPADGSVYILAVNRKHRVINRGSTHRYHLVMDIRDQMGITQSHRYADFLNSSIQN